MKYRKKPVVIEAFRLGYDPQPDWFSDKVAANWVRVYGEIAASGRGFTISHVEIQTLEGTMRGENGDWIIKGVNGELYPCKPDVFEKTYELESEEFATVDKL